MSESARKGQFVQFVKYVWEGSKRNGGWGGWLQSEYEGLLRNGCQFQFQFNLIYLFYCYINCHTVLYVVIVLAAVDRWRESSFASVPTYERLSVLCPLSSVLCPLSSVLGPLSSVLLSSVFDRWRRTYVTLLYINVRTQVPYYNNF